MNTTTYVFHEEIRISVFLVEKGALSGARIQLKEQQNPRPSHRFVL